MSTQMNHENGRRGGAASSSKQYKRLLARLRKYVRELMTTVENTSFPLMAAKTYLEQVRDGRSDSELLDTVSEAIESVCGRLGRRRQQLADILRELLTGALMTTDDRQSIASAGQQRFLFA